MDKSIKCPACQEIIIIKDVPELGKIIECQSCGVEMEIISLEPLEVSLIEEEK